MVKAAVSHDAGRVLEELVQPIRLSAQMRDVHTPSIQERLTFGSDERRKINYVAKKEKKTTYSYLTKFLLDTIHLQINLL